MTDCRNFGPSWYVAAAALVVIAILAVAAFSLMPRRWHWGVRLVPAAIVGAAAFFAAYVLWIWDWVEKCSS